MTSPAEVMAASLVAAARNGPLMPGAPLVSGDNNTVMIMTPERQDELIRLRREQLEAMKPKPNFASNEARLLDSGNSPAAVQ